ncbi:MAG TPA: hypothetical protein VLM42_21670 [Bryobacteraceae bacterium]|nr:hypothetical protein [Bryobacteraceae bacterium]
MPSSTDYLTGETFPDFGCAEGSGGDAAAGGGVTGGEAGGGMVARRPCWFIYAYKKTGRIVTEQNQHLLGDEDRQEWDEALNEYERLSESQRG